MDTILLKICVTVATSEQKCLILFHFVIQILQHPNLFNYEERMSHRKLIRFVYNFHFACVKLAPFGVTTLVEEREYARSGKPLQAPEDIICSKLIRVLEMFCMFCLQKEALLGEEHLRPLY